MPYTPNQPTTEFLEQVFSSACADHRYIDDVMKFVRQFIDVLAMQKLNETVISEYVEYDFYGWNKKGSYTAITKNKDILNETALELKLNLTFLNYESSYNIHIDINKSANSVFIYTVDTDAFEGQFHLGQLALRIDDTVFSECNYIAPSYYVSQPNSILACMRDDSYVRDKGVKSLSVPPQRGIEVLSPIFAHFLTNHNLTPQHLKSAVTKLEL